MKLETKYSIGDKVFRIEKHTAETVIACTVCNDSKQVEIKGTLFKCPNCERGTHKWKQRWFAHTHPTTIGEVRLETKLSTNHNCNYFDEDEIQGDGTSSKILYMLAATGIGSGTLWSEHLIFLTLKEAQKEIEMLNDKLIAEENSMPV